MDQTTILFIFLTFFCWGLGSFISKLAANRIGTQSVFWDVLGYTVITAIFCLFTFRIKSLVQADKGGVLLALLSGAIGAGGVIGWYFVIAKGEISTVVPLLSLYPALTITLAIIFLHESITLTKILGIIFSLLAIYLLSR